MVISNPSNMFKKRYYYTCTNKTWSQITCCFKLVSIVCFPSFVSDYRSGASLSSEIKLYPILPWLQAAHRPGCRTSRWLQLRSTRPTQPAIKRCSRKTRLASCVMWKVKVQVVKFMIVWILIVLNFKYLIWVDMIWKSWELKKRTLHNKIHQSSKMPSSIARIAVPFRIASPSHTLERKLRKIREMRRLWSCWPTAEVKNCVGISSKTGAKARLSESATRTLPC